MLSWICTCGCPPCYDQTLPPLLRLLLPPVAATEPAAVRFRLCDRDFPMPQCSLTVSSPALVSAGRPRGAGPSRFCSAASVQPASNVSARNAAQAQRCRCAQTAGRLSRSLRRGNCAPTDNDGERRSGSDSRRATPQPSAPACNHVDPDPPESSAAPIQVASCATESCPWWGP